MSNIIKAMETEYKGILFRSRLEARWAILFDALELEWVYEPECFKLPSGLKYTPDFYIPKFDLYVEVKPNFDCLSDDYHLKRYREFNRKFLLLGGSYPNFDCNLLMNYSIDTSGNVEDMNVIFCPGEKYEPFFYTGAELGEEESLFKDDWKKELKIVRSHRFYK